MLFLSEFYIHCFLLAYSLWGTRPRDCREAVPSPLKSRRSGQKWSLREEDLAKVHTLHFQSDHKSSCL